METIHAGVIVLVILLIGLALFYVAMMISKLAMHKNVTLRSLLFDFRKKMWMTVGLGVFFFGLFPAVIFITSRWIGPNARLDLFFYVYKHPAEFIYIGLLTFASISIFIYVCRLAIKHMYHKKRKD